MKVGDTVKVFVTFGKYDCWEAWLTGVIEAIHPDPPKDPKALQWWEKREQEYPGFWSSMKQRENSHPSGLWKWDQAYWVHITDDSVKEFHNTTQMFFDQDVQCSIPEP